MKAVICGSSYGRDCHTPICPYSTCQVSRMKWIEGGLAIRVLDMHVKFAKRFTHYLIYGCNELESNKNLCF